MLKCKKILSLLCAVAMLLSMCSMFALAEGTYSNPINVNGESYDNDKTPPAHDISVMSFNILQSDSDITHPYAAPETRFQYAINTIEVYMPDLVGIQEASDNTGLTGANNANWSWEPNLISAMTALGYDYTSLSGQLNTDTGIGQGLILFYKNDGDTDRFTVLGNGYGAGGTLTATYTNLSGGTSTRTDSGRYFQWVKLHDNTYNKDLYFYNTHMSINPNPSDTTDFDDDIAATIGAQFRTQIITQMLADVNSRAKNYPCFMAGDYNTTMKAALAADDANFTTHGQLGLLANYPYMSDSASTADTAISADASNRIDHVFVNSDYAKTVEHRAVQEGWNGQQVSDHFALVSYNNYSANVTFNNTDGLFDRAAGTYTATTASNTYTFDITDNTAAGDVTWTVNGSGSNTISLSKADNTAEIVFSAGGQVINTVTATINYTGASKPTIRATGAVGNHFANSAYQVILNESTSSTTLRVTGGTINGSSKLDLSGITGGRTEYTVTASSGDTYPLYIYKENADAETDKVVYVDDDIGDSTGIVAYYDGENVILLEGNSTNAFSNLEDVAAMYGTTSGYTVYMAPGQYLGNTTYFYKDVTILGANHSTSALDANMNINSARKEETVLVGSVAISCGDNYTYTVKGIHFDGPYNGYNDEFLDKNFDAAIQITTSLSTADRLVTTATLDIQNNLFTGYGDGSGDGTHDSAIRSNTGLQKAGIIANNYFEYTGNGETRGNRAVTFRNVNGLTIENNRFLNFPAPLWLSSEYTNNGTKAGYANYTVQNNRFEACSSNSNGIYNITEDTSANINYYNNDFIRCGYYSAGDPIIEITLADTTLAGSNYYSNVSVSIQGNKFLNCTRGIGINNSLNTATEMENWNSSINDMKVSINRNMFYLPLVRHVHNTYIHYSMRFSFFLDNTLTHDMTLNAENWNLKYNYFESPIYITTAEAEGKTTTTADDGTVYTDTNIVVDDIHDPVNYMNIRITNGETGVVGNSFALTSDLYYPYYTDIAMTNLELPDLTVNVDDVSHVYDGNEYALGDFTVKDGDTVINNALINYSTDGTNYSTTNPTFTEPGTYTVYWKVEMAGYDTATGSATVSITTPTDRVLTFESASATYDGQPHALTFTPVEGDTVTYTYAGDEYSEMPTFTDVGTYKVIVNVTNAKVGNATAEAYMTIEKATIEGVTLLGNFDGKYNGKTHEITILGQPDGTTAYYSVNGGEYTTTAPSIKNIGEYAVTVKISGDNYVDYIDSVTINITEALITGVSVQGETAKVDGNNHGITVNGLVEGDKITFNDGTTTETVTAENSAALTYGEFAKAGSYQVTVTVERDNHIPKTFIASVNLTSGTTKQYFNLVDTDIAVVAGENDKSTFVWDTARSFTDAGAEAFALAAEGEIKIVSFGIKLAKTSEDLLEYQYQFQSGNIAADGSNKYQLSGAVFEINGNNANNPEGLSKVYSKSTYRITGIANLQARYAMSYIRYIIDGVVYEDYGTILATSTILPDLDGDGNPDLGDIGKTDDREDILDDDTTGDIGDTEDREDILDDEETNEGGSAEDNTEVPNP